MNKYEYSHHTANLLSQGKVYKGKDSHVVFSARWKYGDSLQLEWEPKFYNGKLYKLIVIATSNSMYSSSEMMQLSLRAIITRNYGLFGYKIEDYFKGLPKYGWINGNRYIELTAGFDKAMVTYTNILAQQRKDSIQKAHRKKQVKKTLDAF